MPYQFDCQLVVRVLLSALITTPTVNTENSREANQGNRAK